MRQAVGAPRKGKARISPSVSAAPSATHPCPRMLPGTRSVPLRRARQPEALGSLLRSGEHAAGVIQGPCLSLCTAPLACAVVPLCLALAFRRLLTGPARHNALFILPRGGTGGFTKKNLQVKVTPLNTENFILAVCPDGPSDATCSPALVSRAWERAAPRRVHCLGAISRTMLEQRARAWGHPSL